MMQFDIESCSACMACVNVCHKDAISVTHSAEGFLLPKIDEDKCVHCGLCETVCDFRNEVHIGNDMRRAFSFVHSDKRVVEKSSSGGAFTALSDAILEKNGVVVGVTYDHEFNVAHAFAVDREGRDRMRGSKYVQSNPGLLYREIKNKLSKQPVLFVGTPCQCAGLKSYLKKDYDNLFVVDFLCHGVPSNKMFKEHIAYIGKRHKGQPVDYTFRTKKYGWNSSANVITFAELFQNQNSYAKKQRRVQEDSSWLAQAFLTFFAVNLSLRPSCFNCPYRNNHRPSDITIGDFWQIEYLTGKKDKNGVSFVTVNSSKGELLIREVEKNVKLKEYTLEQVKFRLPSNATKKPKRYDAFWNDYQTGGYERVMQKFFNDSFSAKVRWIVKKGVKRFRII